MPKPRICFVTATPMTLRAFMRQHLERLSMDYDVTAISTFTPTDEARQWLPGVRLLPLAISRPIAPLADAMALARLVRLLRAERFAAVHSITPKAGLLGMTAARLAGVPIRIHCFTGQVWATRTGAMRALLKAADRLIARNATHVLTDSFSQRDFLEAEGIVAPGRAVVLGQGSISGVDLARFHPDPARRQATREAWRVPDDACVLLFLGRLGREKGVLELAEAFSRVAAANPHAWLALVGPDEDDVQQRITELGGEAGKRVLRTGFTPEPETYMAAADVLVLPSHREGFGSVVIEAAACGIPAVASRIYGLTDAVVEGETGLLHPPRDVAALAQALGRICEDTALRRRLGAAARDRAVREFSMERIVGELAAFYARLLPPVSNQVTSS